MIRGKYESPCELKKTHITVGEKIVIEKDGKFFLASIPTEEVEVEVISWEELDKK